MSTRSQDTHPLRPRPRRALALALAAMAMVLGALTPAGAVHAVTSSPLVVSGSYQPFTGDFDDDGRTDIFWWDTTTGIDTIWFGGPTKVRTITVQVSGNYQPIVGNFGGSAADDILWYRPGTATDSLWISNGGGFSVRAVSINGTFRPLVGFFDTRSGTDIYWYSGSPGGTDVLWSSRVGGANWGFETKWSGPTRPGARPVVGFSDDPTASNRILFYVPGSTPDPMVAFDGSTFKVSATYAISGDYFPVVTSRTSDGFGGIDTTWTVTWWGPGSKPDARWTWDILGGLTKQAISIPVSRAPVVVPSLGTFESCTPTPEDPTCVTDFETDRSLAWYDSAGGKLIDPDGASTTVPAGAVVLPGRYDAAATAPDSSCSTGDAVVYGPGSRADRYLTNVSDVACDV